jgi:hypothetical protein
MEDRDAVLTHGTVDLFNQIMWCSHNYSEFEVLFPIAYDLGADYWLQ